MSISSSDTNKNTPFTNDFDTDTPLITIDLYSTGRQGCCSCEFTRIISLGIDEDNELWMYIDGSDHPSCYSPEPSEDSGTTIVGIEQCLQYLDTHFDGSMNYNDPPNVIINNQIKIDTIVSDHDLYSEFICDKDDYPRHDFNPYFTIPDVSHIDENILYAINEITTIIDYANVYESEYME